MAQDQQDKGGRLRRALKRALSGKPKAPEATGPCTVTFVHKDTVVAEGVMPQGTPLLLAAAKLGVRLEHFCGGCCSCGTCRVEVLGGAENLSPREGREELVLGAAHVMAGNRLACQAKTHGPVKVRVPEWF
jgi:ferredoxin